MSDDAGVSRLDKLVSTVILKLRGDASWTSTPALFVLSTGRTGTESLAQLLKLSPKVMALHEPRPQLLRERKEAFERVFERPQEFERIFRASRRRLIASAGLRGKVYAETSARLTFFAPIISELMPQAQFVHLFRHPADVIRSGMRRGWYASHPADRYRITPPPETEAADCWESWTRFEKICWYWAAYNEFAMRATAAMDPSRVLIVETGHLFSVDAGKWREVFERVGVAPPPTDLVRSLLSVRHNVQTSGDFPEFDEWTPAQRAILDRQAGETMRKLGLPSAVDCERITP